MHGDTLDFHHPGNSTLQAECEHSCKLNIMSVIAPTRWFMMFLNAPCQGTKDQGAQKHCDQASPKICDLAWVWISLFPTNSNLDLDAYDLLRGTPWPKEAKAYPLLNPLQQRPATAKWDNATAVIIHYLIHPAHWRWLQDQGSSLSTASSSQSLNSEEMGWAFDL